ncbi:hypothetical protein RYX36_023513 [Vicia faba]
MHSTKHREGSFQGAVEKWSFQGAAEEGSLQGAEEESLQGVENVSLQGRSEVSYLDYMVCMQVYSQSIYISLRSSPHSVIDPKKFLVRIS